MLVSVVVPTFNRAHTLKRALDSVVSQTDKNWEMIVIDDGSTDDTQQVLESWRKSHSNFRIQIVQRENSGVSAARNQGVRLANGEWIAFLDSDDEWLPQRLERQRTLTAKFVWIHSEEIWIRNGRRVNAMKKHQKSGGRIFNRCVDLCCVSPSAVLLKKEEFLKLGGFRENFPVCEDYDLWLKFAAQFDAGYISEPLIIKYGGHDDQLSRRFKAMDYWRALSLKSQLGNPYLTSPERIYLETNLSERLRILEEGFAKHGGQDWPWKSDLRDLIASHNDHSAADRRPRSESSGVL